MIVPFFPLMLLLTKLLHLQTQKLREEIQGWLGSENPAAFHAGAIPSAWGGVLRGDKFPWRQMAQKVVFGKNGQGILIYRSRS